MLRKVDGSLFDCPSTVLQRWDNPLIVKESQSLVLVYDPTTRVGIVSNMKADLLLRERLDVSEHAFVELVVWAVAKPLEGSRHCFKYRLAYVVQGVCVLRYDNEAGKGDHRHIRGREVPYEFTTPDRLVADFWRDVDRWRPQ